MLAQSRVLAIAVAAGLASSASATDRFWIESVIGTWDDGGNWSLSSGGGAGGGLPQTDDDIHFDRRTICIFDGAGIANPHFGEITLSGVFSGVTSVRQSDSPWSADRMTIGLASTDCEFVMSGGSAIVGEMLVGRDPGGEGLLEVNGSAELLVTSVIDVGMHGATGDVIIDGSLFEFDEMNISFGLVNPGVGHVDVLGGTVLGDDIRVGIDGRGSLTQVGGDVDVNGYTVGTQPSVTPSTSVHSAGTLDVAGFLQVAPAQGDGSLTIDGADVTCGTLLAGEGPGASAELSLSAGSLDATTVRIGLEGDAALMQTGGVFSAGEVIIGEFSGANSGVWECFGGLATVNGDVLVGAGNSGMGRLDIDGGQVTCEALRIAETNASFGIAVLESGSLNVDSMVVGVGDTGQYLQRGGALSAGSVMVDPMVSQNSLFQITGPDFGTADISTFTNRSDAQVFGGVVTIDTLTNHEGAEFRLGNSPDVRVTTLVNDGSFVFGTGSVILSGSYFSFPVEFRLLGSFQNNGTLSSSTGMAGSFVMDLTNDGVVDVLHAAAIVSDGFVLNRGEINVDSDGSMFTAALICNNVSGIDNQGTVFLDQGVIGTTGGDFVNRGEIQGPGLIQGGLDNRGLIGRGGQLSELVIEGGYTSDQDAVLEFQRYPGAHNSIRVATGDAQLAGHLEVDFEFFTPSPGAEYMLLRTETGSVIGTFDSVNITDANAEILYEADRVIVRVLTPCNEADLAEPYGALDFSDVVSFLTWFGSSLPGADLAPPFGVWDFSDVVAFLAAFGAGCP
ncbi:MAG: GC-type dockerin domain-anchored protein [Phycisphaerales bacterium JB059]